MSSLTERLQDHRLTLGILMVVAFISVVVILGARFWFGYFPFLESPPVVVVKEEQPKTKPEPSNRSQPPKKIPQPAAPRQPAVEDKRTWNQVQQQLNLIETKRQVLVENVLKQAKQAAPSSASLSSLSHLMESVALSPDPISDLNQPIPSEDNTSNWLMVSQALTKWWDTQEAMVQSIEQLNGNAPLAGSNLYYSDEPIEFVDH